jgi:hypothetical protein
MTDERAHLHDGEVLLCSVRATPAAFLSSLGWALLDAAAIGILGVAALLFSSGPLNVEIAPFVYAVPFVIIFVLSAFLRFRVWRHALFRLTTERILLEFPGRLFHSPVRTIKWSQYQESFAGHKSLFDFFFGSRPLVIKFGTAEAKSETSFPSLTYAVDLKHFMDKIDSAVRRADTASLKPFVLKGKGERE